MILLGSSTAMISNAQLRAARGLLDWSQSKLAERAGLSLPTIKRLERGWQGVSEDAQAKVANALETAGVVFINGDEPGVKLRKGQT